MSLDLLSVSIMSALVVNVSGIFFLVETMIRRDEGAGRIWAVAFLAGMLTSVAYLIWASDRGAWWAVAVGNAAFVATTGSMWVGCRSYNERRLTASTTIVAVVVTGALVAAILPGPDGGDWAGALWMFCALIAFAVAGSVESLRGEMGRLRTSWALATVLAVQALFYIARTIVFVVFGPDSSLFVDWFGTVATSFVTVTLTIVALVVTSVLRARRAELRGYSQTSQVDWPEDGILPTPVFERMLADMTDRARRRSEIVSVIAFRVEDLEQISTAYGDELLREMVNAWRGGVRRYARASSLIGEDGPGGLVIGFASLDAADARRDAARIYGGTFDDLGAVVGGIIPVVGVGMALSETVGYDVRALLRTARAMAGRAVMSTDSPVLVDETGEERLSSP